MVAILMISFFIGLAIGIPIALVMGVASLISFLYEGSLPLQVLSQRVFAGIDSFPMMAIPFFILAAELMTAGKLTEMLIKFANDLVGHVRGGLGHVNVIVSMLFAGISGSALADAAGPGALVLKMMRVAGYDAYYSGALTAASAVIGPIIPPSIIMVIYALNESKTTVTGLFLAGIVPGLLLGGILMLSNYMISVRRNYPFTLKRVPLKELSKSFIRAIVGLMMPVIILGGILTGIFTPTEAAAVAVGYALFIGVFLTRNLNHKNIPQIFLKSAIISSAVLLLVSMGSAFSWVLAYAQVPQQVALWISGLTQNPTLILILIAILSTISGMFIDTLPAVIILTPVLAPVATQFGIPVLQTAMVIVLSLTVGMLTPPVAPLLFVVSIVGRLKVEKLVIEIIPLILVEFVIILLVILFPAVATILPRLLGYLH